MYCSFRESNEKTLWEASCLFKFFCEAAVHLDMSILCLSSLRARKSILFPYPSATLWATAIGIRPTVGVAMPWYSNLTLSYITEFFICLFASFQQNSIYFWAKISCLTILVFMRNAGTNETRLVMGWKLNWQILKNLLLKLHTFLS